MNCLSYNRFLKLSVGVCLLFLIQCIPTQPTPTSTSSGFFIEDTKTLPPGLPKRVSVSQFMGEYPINIQATDQFASGLVKLGFDVVERNHITKVFDELGLQYSGIIDEKTRIELGKQLGLEAIFVGSVTGESSPRWVDTHLNVKLVDIKTGKVMWTATARDPRAYAESMDVRSSIIYTVADALEKLENDLLKLEKSQELTAVELNRKALDLFVKGRYTDTQSALSYLNRAISLDPGNVYAYNNRGLVWIQKGNYDRAIEDFSKVIELDPNMSIAYRNRGIAWSRNGEYDRALGDYGKSLEIEPESVIAAYNIACIYSIKNNIPQACRWLRKAIANGFKDWQHIKKDRELDNIRDTECFKEIMSSK